MSDGLSSASALMTRISAPNIQRLRARWMMNGNGRVKLPSMSPLKARKKSQIEEYPDYYT